MKMKSIRRGFCIALSILSTNISLGGSAPEAETWNEIGSNTWGNTWNNTWDQTWCEKKTEKNHYCIAHILDLHPTQFAVGQYEVEEKISHVKHILADGQKALRDFENANPVPALISPKGDLFIIDHHHLITAYHYLGVDPVLVWIVANYSNLESMDAFWNELEKNKWVYPFDEHGNGPWPHQDLPQTILELKDDPYRSLASAARRAGAYTKQNVPFTEFLWAQFFRKRVHIGPTRGDFQKAVALGVKIAHSPEAAEMPGYLGLEADISTGSNLPIWNHPRGKRNRCK